MGPHFQLKKGRVYRTEDFAKWTANPSRLVARLVDEGLLMRLGHGLYPQLETSKFGPTPPTDQELMRGFLKGTPFVFTGPEKWNALGLGSTAMFATSLVYNTKRSGRFEFGGRAFLLRRVKFPLRPTPEWFVVDLLENASSGGASREDLAAALGRAIRRGAFDRARLQQMASGYATKANHAWVQASLRRGAS